MCVIDKKIFLTITYIIFGAITINTSTLLDWHTSPIFPHKAFIAYTSRLTALIVTAVWQAVQVRTGGSAGRDTIGVMTVLGTRGC